MNVVNRAVLLTAGIALACTGCAPIYIDVPQPKKNIVVAQRDVTVIHGVAATETHKEYVITDVMNMNELNPEEMVVWVSGVDLKKSKLQRPGERLAGDAQGDRLLTFNTKVEVYSFGVSKAGLSVAGQLALEKFKAKTTDRFYVEFLNNDEMNEKNVNQMVDVWRDLSVKLKSQGLNTANVVMGGSKYGQETSAIVMVKVGK